MIELKINKFEDRKNLALALFNNGYTIAQRTGQNDVTGIKKDYYIQIMGVESITDEQQNQIGFKVDVHDLKSKLEMLIELIVKHHNKTCMCTSTYDGNYKCLASRLLDGEITIEKALEELK